MEQLTHLLISTSLVHKRQNEQRKRKRYRKKRYTITIKRCIMYFRETYVETLYDHFYLERINNESIKLI